MRVLLPHSSAPVKTLDWVSRTQMLSVSLRGIPLLGLGLFVLLHLIACTGKNARQDAKPQPSASAAQPQNASLAAFSPEEPPVASSALVLPPNFARHTDDLDEMAKRRNIRALVILNPIGFFYQNGLPKGAMYEALQEFQKFTNSKLKSGPLQVQVTLIPVRVDQVEAYLTAGIGDIVAYGVAITPERANRVAFSVPLQTDSTQIIVTGTEYSAVATLEGLGGKEVYANPLTIYFENLRKVNDSLQKAGKPLILIRPADKNLTDDDLIQMVGAGLIPATVTTQLRANLWSQVFDNLKPHPELMIASKVQLAWVMRKDNPQLKQLVDEFVEGHAVETSFGNTLLRRYLQNTKWVKNSTSQKEMQKFLVTVKLFQKYAAEYDFDYVMLAAQGYQESMLNQEMRSPRGAVGIMQVLPKYASASPINISDVAKSDGNIHAGAKMLRNIADTYFNDPKLDPLNRTLFVFAGYNAGPSRIQRLRKEAAATGLDPDVWFGNVELVAAKDIGQETVTYVGNIYKYYVAYKLTLEQRQLRQK
jgi:membrane-bound lytic murein transglycosylase MltF